MSRESRFVYSHPLMVPMAENFTNGYIVRTIERNLFPNKMPNIKIHLDTLLDHVGKADVLYFSYYSDMAEKKIEEMIIWVLADTLNIRTLTIVDLYDPLATMERVDANDEGRIATSNVDAQWWKSLPRNVNRILFDHHTLQNRFYFTGGKTEIWFKSAMHLIADKPGTIAFPDAGAAKRFGSFFKDKNIVTCAKKREGDDRIVVIQEGDPKGKDVIIVDDLVRSGGTLIQCLKAVKEAGAKKVYMFVTHAEFPEESWKKFIGLPDLEQFYITDTIYPVASKLASIPTFSVLSVIDDIKKVVEQIEAD